VGQSQLITIFTDQSTTGCPSRAWEIVGKMVYVFNKGLPGQRKCPAR